MIAVDLTPPSRPPRGRRSRTINVLRLSKRALILGRIHYPDEGQHADRPRTRAECPTGPCPWVSCKYHLALDVDPANGSIKLNFPGLDVDEMTATCALDVAELEDGERILAKVGAAINLTRERLRQIELKALARARRMAALPRHRVLRAMAAESDGAP